MCHSKGNVSLKSQATTLLYRSPKLTPHFYIGGSHLKPSDGHILITSIDLTIEVCAANSTTIGRSHVWLIVSSSV